MDAPPSDSALRIMSRCRVGWCYDDAAAEARRLDAIAAQFPFGPRVLGELAAAMQGVCWEDCRALLKDTVPEFFTTCPTST